MNIKWECDSGAAAAALEAKIGEMIAKAPKGIAEGAEIVRDNAKAICPVDTGNLRASLESKSSGMQATVGTNVEYGIYQEFGTYKMAAQPYLRPSLTSCEGEVLAAVKKAMGL